MLVQKGIHSDSHDPKDKENLSKVDELILKLCQEMQEYKDAHRLTHSEECGVVVSIHTHASIVNKQHDPHLLHDCIVHFSRPIQQMPTQIFVL